MHKRKPGERIHLTITIPYGFPIFLCQKEGRTTQTLPRLSIPQRLDDQEPYPLGPLPLISELTDKLAGAKYFTKIDV